MKWEDFKKYIENSNKHQNKVGGMEKLIFLDDAIEALQGREAIISSAYDAVAAIKTVPTIKTSEDCISRADLIKSFLTYNKCKREEAKECLCFLDFMLELIEDAPSVTTEQSSMVGKWQITDAYPHNVYCSECHKKIAQTHWTVWEDGSLPRSYCPNCGAKMKG